MYSSSHKHEKLTEVGALGEGLRWHFLKNWWIITVAVLTAHFYW